MVSKITYIILDAAITKFGGNKLKYFSVEPATFSHGIIWMPVRGYSFEP